MRWWQGRKGTNRVLIAAFGFLAITAIVMAGIFTRLLGGDSRQVVVNMQQGITEADRQTVKDACGGLPGISVIADRGRADRQYAFPVRFRLTGSTPAQESALYACLDGFPQLVRGPDPVSREGS